MLVATYEDAQLSFAPGNFDDWCIYLTINGKSVAPTDEWYFGILEAWARYLVPDYIYYDFIQIYDRVTTQVDPSVLELIERISFAYPDYTQACIIWTILYMGMLAEENKGGKVLGKRIKRLGVYQVLIERTSAVHAAHYSRGKSTIELAPYCNERGF